MVPPEALPVFTTTIMAALETVVDVIGDVFTAVTANGLLAFLAASSVFGVGVSAFRRLKRAAR